MLQWNKKNITIALLTGFAASASSAESVPSVSTPKNAITPIAASAVVSFSPKNAGISPLASPVSAASAVIVEVNSASKNDVKATHVIKPSSLSSYIDAQKSALITEVNKINLSNSEDKTKVKSDATIGAIDKPVKIIQKPLEVKIPPPPEPIVLGVMNSIISGRTQSIAEVAYLERVYLLNPKEMISNSGWIVGNVSANSAIITKEVPVLPEVVKNKKKNKVNMPSQVITYNTLTRKFGFPDVTYKLN